MASGGAAPVLYNFGKEMQVSLLGTVIDDFGRGVPKVSISLLTGQVTIANTRTSDEGEFEFHKQAVKVGIYEIRAAIPGFDPTEEKITLIWDMKDTSLNLALRIRENNKPAVNVDKNEEELEERNARQIALEESKKELAVDWSVPNLPSLPEDKAKYVHLRVLFATDRYVSKFEENPIRRYAAEPAPDGKLSFGVCDVQVPNARRLGTLPRPSIFKLQFREDPNKHVILKTCEELNSARFYQEISNRGPSVLLFVHGYFVTFAEAIYRTAQIARDIQFDGTPVCYSWPSKGRFWAYGTDEDSVQWTRPHLFDVLSEILRLENVTTVNVIAHSMGNRATIECIEAIVREFSGTKRVNQLVFAAPDVSTGIFRQFMDRIKGGANKYTLYASSNDKPLKWSQWFHSWDRAGEGGEKLVIHPILDSIDATAVPCGVFDHSYYGSTFTVLSDIHELFTYNAGPPRFAIAGPKSKDGGKYWEVKN